MRLGRLVFVVAVAAGVTGAAADDERPPATAKGIAALRAGAAIQYTRPGLPPIRARPVELSAGVPC